MLPNTTMAVPIPTSGHSRRPMDPIAKTRPRPTRAAMPAQMVTCIGRSTECSRRSLASISNSTSADGLATVDSSASVFKTLA